MPWGAYATDAMCPPGEKLSGFIMKSEPNQGRKGDDTAANALKMYCSNRMLFNLHENPYGRWGNLIMCPTNAYICGLRAQVETPLGRKEDDTALNNVMFYCCV